VLSTQLSYFFLILILFLNFYNVTCITCAQYTILILFLNIFNVTCVTCCQYTILILFLNIFNVTCVTCAQYTILILFLNLLIQSAFTKILPKQVDFAERMCIMNVVKIFLVLHIDLSEDTHVVTIIFISNNNNNRILECDTT
jgi:hypothetical protein